MKFDKVKLDKCKEDIRKTKEKLWELIDIQKQLEAACCHDLELISTDDRVIVYQCRICGAIKRHYV